MIQAVVFDFESSDHYARTCSHLHNCAILRVSWLLLYLLVPAV